MSFQDKSVASTRRGACAYVGQSEMRFAHDKDSLLSVHNKSIVMPAHIVDILMSAIHWDSLLLAHNKNIVIPAHNVDILMSAIHWDSAVRTQREHCDACTQRGHSDVCNSLGQSAVGTQRDNENSIQNEDILPLGQRLGTFHLFECSLLFRFAQRGQSIVCTNKVTRIVCLSTRIVCLSTRIVCLSTWAVCRLHMTRILQKSVCTALRSDQKRPFARIYHFSWRIN